MKKALALILAAFMLAFALVGCVDNGGESSAPASSTSSSNAETESKSDIAEIPVVRLAGMKGPTSIGLVGLLEEDSKDNTQNDYEFSLHGAATEIVPLLTKGELDIAAVPANLASTLYNNTNGAIKLLAVNNLGVVYIVAKNESISSVEDLRGKTIYATGKGSTPEIALRHILSGNGIDPDKDVTIEYRDEASAVLPELVKNESAIAMLPQPYVTVASAQVEGLETVIDLNAEWEKLNPDCGLVTGVIVVRKEFAEKNPEAVKAFLKEYKASVDFVLGDVPAAAQLVAKHGIFEKAAVMEKAIPKCNITYIAGEDMKAPVNKYLGVSYEQNPKSIGGKLPEDDFFYIAE
ncbi:MAG: ABC transporter substrate-binding protein [Clostridia bacterium]|nr:ABC transporter substrate-binding protein [Clostridia bacterium]